ncbi:MAG: hypothetical protein KF819_25405 [Labilithrix sp.]|nr:hypothetical protein [Labilithrix sp.]
MKFDPFGQMNKAFEAWQKAANDSFARATAFYGEMDKLESKGIERTAVAIDEIAVLQKETLAYGAQLGAEWRKLTLESFKQAQAAFAPST